MTINVAIKCPEGIVLGCDSLTTITDNYGNIVSSIPYTSKLFSLGDFRSQDKSFPVGAMINGSHSIGGTRVEDIIEEFEEKYANEHSPDEYSVAEMARNLVEHIQYYINTTLGQEKNVRLEIILAGFSKIKKVDSNVDENKNQVTKKNKYGEIYRYFWEDTRKAKYSPLSDKEREFGTFYGGQPTALDRFRYGIDDWVLYTMLERKNWLYEQVRYYIYHQLKKKSKDIPDIMEVQPPKNMSEYNIFQLFSNGEPGKTIGETIRNIKENMTDRLQTMEGMFNLQSAINYCIFLMSCAYAHSAFTFVTPVVGSEMRVASVTRQEGFKFRRIWEIQTPGPPFR
jgi:hypothetical protein